MSQEAEPDRPRGKPGKRGTPVHHLGAGRAETAERRVKELEALLRDVWSESNDVLAGAYRRVAELEALVLEYQAAERALYVARCVDDGGSDDINHCRKRMAAAGAELLAWKPSR